MARWRRFGLFLSVLLLELAPAVEAQTPIANSTPQGAAQQAPAEPPTFATTVTVVESAPLPGVDLPIEKIPAPVQTATSEEIERSKALDLSSFLTRRFNDVFANEIQNNPFQPDINYRGYTASPLLGTPQGLSVYMDGVRLNQPFGDVVSWDLIPRLAISTNRLTYFSRSWSPGPSSRSMLTSPARTQPLPRHHNIFSPCAPVFPMNRLSR